MKTLLIFPPMTIKGGDTTTPGASAPLGIAYLGAYLESNGCNVSILDTLAEGFNILKKKKNYLRVGLSSQDIAQKIKYYKPDIIGISTMFTAFAADAHEVAKIAKKILPKTFVVFGGAHASMLPKTVLKDKNVDMVIIGEGEITLLELVQKLEKNKNINNILGTVIRNNNGQLIYNQPRPPIYDLDSLPMPARHLLPMDVYLNFSAAYRDSYTIRSPSTSIITSRGCPNNCIYCAVPGIWGRRWRPYSAIRIVDEIEQVVKRYNVKEVSFLDDNISVDKQRLEKICDEIIKRKIDIKWTCPNGIAIWTLDKNLLQKMKKSGCYRLTFGIESGYPETQKYIRKNLDLNKATKIMKIASDLGLWIFSTYIIGFPYETKKAIQSTFNYAIRSHSDFIAFFLLMPFPGTDVTKIMESENILKKSDLKPNKIGELFSGYKGMGNKYLSQVELRQLQNKAHKQLMFSRLARSFIHPLILIKKIKTFEDFKYLLKISKNYLALLFSTIKFGELKTHRIREALKFQIVKNR